VAAAESLRIAELVADARRIIAGDADVTIPEICRIGSSAGGVRPKANILYSEGRGEVGRCSRRRGRRHRVDSRVRGVGEPTLEGTVLTFEGVDPIEIRYAITCNDNWTTRLHGERR
jgi:hypothetical protein